MDRVVLPKGSTFRVNLTVLAALSVYFGFTVIVPQTMDDELSCAKFLNIMELGKREEISVGLRSATSFRNLKDSTLYTTVHKKVIIKVSMVHWKITCRNNLGGSSAAEKKLLQTRIGRRMTSVMLENGERVQSGSAAFSRKCR